MRRIRQAVALLTVVLIAHGTAQAVDPKPTTLFVDACRTNSWDLRTSEVAMIDLQTTDYLHEELFIPIKDPAYPIGAKAGGTVTSTLPAHVNKVIFVGAGSQLAVHKVQNTTQGNGLPAPDIVAPDSTHDLATMAGISGLQISSMAAGNFRPAQQSPGVMYAQAQASLYVTGTVDSDSDGIADEAYYIILDQQYLIEGVASNGTHLYAVNQICAAAGVCHITDVLDIEIGPHAVAGQMEEGFISAIHNYGTPAAPFNIQIAYRLERGLSETAHTLTPVLGDLWASPTVVGTQRAGIGASPTGGKFYGPTKSIKTIRNLADNTDSCALPGEPIDVAVWEPGISSAESRYLVAVSMNGSQPRLDIMESTSCLSGGGSSVISIPLVGNGAPQAMDLAVIDDDEIWVAVTSHTTAADAAWEMVRIQISSNGGVDSFSFHDQYSYATMFDPLTDSCPTDVHIFDRASWTEMPWYSTPGCKFPNNCGPVLLQCAPSDPRCLPPTTRP